MAGGSYLAAMQWLAAAENPPHLKAIAPWIAAGSPFSEAEMNGGVFSLYLSSAWIPTMAVDVADRLEKQGKDVNEMRRMISRAIFNPEEVYSYLPLKDVPHFKFERIQQMWLGAFRQVLDRQLVELARRPYHKITVPCFNCSGWYDVFTWSTFDNYRKMKERGGSELARKGQHVLMGPWIHGARLLGFWGDLNFGPSAGVPGNLATEHNLAFFNKYLLGKEIEIPAVRYFLMGANRWKTADDWPLPQTQWQRYYLHSRGSANTAAGNGWLSREEPGSESPDVYVYNPLNPVPTVGGRVLPIAGLVPGPIDQQHIEKRSDILCYTSEELKEDMEVTGPLELHLFAATSVKDTDFTAKLIDVWHDGRAYNAAEGIIRAKGRQSIYQTEMVTPGYVNEYVINLGGTSQLVRRGHRIRIDVSSSDFPKYDRNMNTGNPIGEDAQGIPAIQTIYHQTGQASYIDLPVIPAK
jgi:putative CocE/NonD family hydrolase